MNPPPRPSRIEHFLTLAGLAGAVVLLVTLFLPWHTVREADWAGAFCWAPDCRPVGGGGTTSTHSGFSELGPVGLVLVLAFAAAEFVLVRRPDARWRWIPALAAVAAVVALGYAVFRILFFAHLFDSVGSQAAESIFVLGLTVLALVASTQLSLAVAAGRRVRAARAATRPEAPGASS